MDGYRDGIDLILGVMQESKFVALGHSETCKITHKSDTGTRKVKPTSMPTTAEAAAAMTSSKFEEKYIKTLSTSITSNGFVYKGDAFGYPELEALWLSGAPLVARWGYKDEIGLTSAAKYHEASCVISQLENEGKAGDDETWSLTLDNSGEVKQVTNGTNAGA